MYFFDLFLLLIKFYFIFMNNEITILIIIYILYDTIIISVVIECGIMYRVHSKHKH